MSIILAIEAANRKGIQGERAHKARFLKRIILSRLPTEPRRINVMPTEETRLFLMSTINTDIEDIVAMIKIF
jgi:hypothetical protein